MPEHKDPHQPASEAQTNQSRLKKAAVYARVVSMRERPSEEEQVEQIRAFALKYDFVLEAVYTDYGTGSGRTEREGLDALLQAAVDGEFDFIIVTDRSRIFDTDRLVEEYQDFLWRHSRVDLIFLDEVRKVLGE